MNFAITIHCGSNPESLSWFIPAFAVLAFLIGVSHFMALADRWRLCGDEPGFVKDFTLDAITTLLFFGFVAGVVVFGFGIDCAAP